MQFGPDSLYTVEAKSNIVTITTSGGKEQEPYWSWNVNCTKPHIEPSGSVGDYWDSGECNHPGHCATYHPGVSTPADVKVQVDEVTGMQQYGWATRFAKGNGGGSQGMAIWPKPKKKDPTDPEEDIEEDLFMLNLSGMVWEDVPETGKEDGINSYDGVYTPGKDKPIERN